jgi:hypothetical protein
VFIVDNLAVWRIPSQTFRRSALPARADCCLLRRCLWLRCRLAPTSASSGSSGCPASWLAPGAFDLRTVRSPGFFRLASGALVSGFLRLALSTLVERSVLRPLPSTDFRPQSSVRPLLLLSIQLPARAGCCVRQPLQRFTSDLLLVHQLDQPYGSPPCARKCESVELCGYPCAFLLSPE